MLRLLKEVLLELFNHLCNLWMYGRGQTRGTSNIVRANGGQIGLEGKSITLTTEKIEKKKVQCKY